MRAHQIVKKRPGQIDERCIGPLQRANRPGIAKLGRFAERTLALQYRRIATTYELIKIQRSQREAFADQLRARFLSFLQGRQDTPLNLLLQAQRRGVVEAAEIDQRNDRLRH